MRIKLIANPIAGGDARKALEDARTFLEAQGANVDIFLTGARGDAEREARRTRNQGYDRLLVAGGDGTVNEVINGLAPCAIPIAILPLGTTNVLALEMGIPLSLEGACRVALEGTARPVCLGLAGERRFMLMAGIGFDAEVVRTVSTRLKRMTGKAAYAWSALRTFLLWRSPNLEVELADGSVHNAFGAIVGNGRLYGGRFTLTPQADLEQDDFEICLLLRRGRLPLLRMIARMLLHRPMGKDVLLLKTGEATIRGSAAPVQLDGDYFGRLPLTFRTTFGELSLVYPINEEP